MRLGAVERVDQIRRSNHARDGEAYETWGDISEHDLWLVAFYAQEFLAIQEGLVHEADVLLLEVERLALAEAVGAGALTPKGPSIAVRRHEMLIERETVKRAMR